MDALRNWRNSFNSRCTASHCELSERKQSHLFARRHANPDQTGIHFPSGWWHDYQLSPTKKHPAPTRLSICGWTLDGTLWLCHGKWFQVLKLRRQFIVVEVISSTLLKSHFRTWSSFFSSHSSFLTFFALIAKPTNDFLLTIYIYNQLLTTNYQLPTTYFSCLF